MKEFLLSQDLLIHLRRYLGTKPYDEATGFIEALKQLKEAPKEDDKIPSLVS